jgi:chitinase domain-containing protein 1
MANLSAILIFCLICLACCTLGPDDKKKKDKKKATESSKKKQSKGAQYNFASLIRREIESAKEIIDNHENVCATCPVQKKINGKLLGYVTPWNSKGYEITKKFGNKFDFISPVWLQVRKILNNKEEGLKSLMPVISSSSQYRSSYFPIY